MKKGSKMSLEARAKISTSLLGNSRRAGIPHDEETKRRVSVAMKRAYIEGRHLPSGGVAEPKNFTAWLDALRAGIVRHPKNNPERDAAILESYIRTLSLKETGLQFDLTGSAIGYAVRRAAPSTTARKIRKERQCQRIK